MPNTVPGLPDVYGRGSQLAQRCPLFDSATSRRQALAAHFGVEVSATNPTSPKPERSLSRLLPGEKSGPRCRMLLAWGEGFTVNLIP